MRTQFTKKRPLARKSLFFLATGALSGLFSAPQTSLGAELTPSGLMSVSSLGWLEQLLGWVEELYILIGGDPATLDRAGTADARILNLAHYFNAHGIPDNLGTVRRAQLIEDIHNLYAASLLPIEGISLRTNVELRKALEKLWVDLGLNLEDLWS